MNATRKCWMLAILTVVGIALVLSGCTKGTETTTPTGPSPIAAQSGEVEPPTDVKIGFIVKQPEEPWFQNEWKFAQQAADQYGFELIKIGAPDGEKVEAAIDSLATNGAQGALSCVTAPSCNSKLRMVPSNI